VNEQNGPPTGWTTASLGDCAVRITDGTHLPPQFEESGIPFIFIKHIVGGRITFQETKFISEQTFAELNGRCPVELGDILYSAVGSYGVAVSVLTDRKFSFQRHIAHIKPHKELDQKYLTYCLNSPLCISQAHKMARGVAQKTVTLGDLKRFDLPIAPLNEQRRIVAKIEELFSNLDAGVAALKRIKANLKRYRAAVLKAAVEGRLTDAWRAKYPKTEPASKLLERILTERRKKWEEDQVAKFAAANKTLPKGWQEKYVEATGPETSRLPELPQGWCWGSVDQLSIVVRGASPRPAGDPRFFGGPVPWITVGALTAHDTPYLREVSEGLTEAGRDASRYIQPDTLLLTNSGATLGVPKITLIGGCINDGSVALFHVNYPLKLYLYYFLKTQTRLLRAINQGAAQPNLNTGIVKTIVVPLPPLVEQQQILAEIERKLSVVEENETLIEGDLKRAARLRQCILKRAFEGKLVPQDPTDEPADKLLDRIRQERESSNIQEGMNGSARRRTRGNAKGSTKRKE
jgi:type I restriction enzyme, S subunit